MNKEKPEDINMWEQENGRTVRLCPFFWKTTTVIVHFAHASYYTYNQAILGFYAPSSEMRVKDWSYSLSPKNLKPN